MLPPLFWMKQSWWGASESDRAVGWVDGCRHHLVLGQALLVRRWKTITGVALVVTVVACILAIYTDAKWMIIPNWLTYSLIGFGLLYHLAHGWEAFLSSLKIGLIVGLVFFIPSILGQVGMGDVKFMTGMGIWSNLLFVVQAFVLASFIALFQILTLLIWKVIIKKQPYRDVRKKPIPYGVSLGLGILIVTGLSYWQIFTI